MLIQYLFAYSGDIEIIYCLKNGLIDPKEYASSILKKKIGIDGVYYILKRMKSTFLLLEISLNFVNSSEEQNSLFGYIAEMVLNQLAEEYIFVKSVVSALLRKFNTIEQMSNDQQWLLSFLQFYERFVWNSKKINEVTETYKFFILKNSVKFPDVLVLEVDTSSKMNDMLIQYSELLNKFKLQSDKMHPGLKKTKGLDSFSKFCEISTKNANNILLFSQKNVLNKLEMEVVQQRPLKEDAEINTEGED